MDMKVTLLISSPKQRRPRSVQRYARCESLSVNTQNNARRRNALRRLALRCFALRQV